MNDNDKFKVGDVVVLNSEGPHMTVVTHIAPSGACGVSWFSQDGSHNIHEFPEQCLRLVFRHGDN